MTEQSEEATTPPKDESIAPASDAGKSEANIPPRIARAVLLLVFFVLVNLWFLIQFGVKLGSVPIAVLVVSVAAAIRQHLRAGEAKAIDRIIEKVVDVLLSTPALVTMYGLLVGVTLMGSSIVMTDPKAKKDTCILAGSNTTCSGNPLLSDENKATFFLWTTPLGKAYRVRFEDSDELPVKLWPWLPTKLDKSRFTYSPSILVRVPYPHLDIVDGCIEIRDPSTKVVLTSAVTTEDSAALLIGRNVEIPPSLKTWEDEIEADGAMSQTSIKRAELRWQNHLNPSKQLKLVAGQQLTAVFRTQKQRSSSDPDDVAASAPIKVVNGEPMMDIKLVRKKR